MRFTLGISKNKLETGTRYHLREEHLLKGQRSKSKAGQAGAILFFILQPSSLLLVPLLAKSITAPASKAEMGRLKSQPQHHKEGIVKGVDLKLRDNSLITSTSMMAVSIIHLLEDIYALAGGFCLFL